MLNIRQDCPIHRTMPSDHVCDSNPLFTDDTADYIRPCMDSASWLYVETDPIIQFVTPMVSIVNPHEHDGCHSYHHNHPYRYQHQYQRNNYQSRRHRRIFSDPGGFTYSCINRNQSVLHRRNISVDNSDIIGHIIGMNDDENCTNHEMESRTPTFRKVPWHPNLHMLKIR